MEWNEGDPLEITIGAIKSERQQEVHISRKSTVPTSEVTARV